MHDRTIAPPAKPIAHWAHTLAVVLILVLVAVRGHLRADSGQMTGPAAGPHLLRYGSSLLLEWLLLGAVVAGIYRRRDFFRTAFLQTERSNLANLGLGIGAYAAGSAAILLTSLALNATPLGHRRNLDVILAMLPHDGFELALWFLVSLTAGVCEELIFRGYLWQQFSAWTRRPLLAVFLTALLFGSVHLYEGIGAILPLAALAVVYGLVVYHFKGDLRAVIVAHTLQDFLVAVFALLVPHLRQMQHP